MTLDSIKALLQERVRLRARQKLQAGDRLRPDAAAWLLLAFGGSSEMAELCARADGQLCEAQSSDGRISIAPQFPQAAWPTPLAILAWSAMPERRDRADRAANFLLNWRGLTFPNEPEVLGHDTTLAGWPWISGTHSWIDPTALSLLALKRVGHGNTDRCVEARKLILNRQLPGGGWNYGNTTVLGRELRPMIHCTGIALAAMASQVPEASVARSIEYLERVLVDVRSPLSLSWGIMGLAAWGRGDGNEEWVNECLEKEEEIGEYDLALLCLLYCALIEKDHNPLIAAVA